MRLALGAVGVMLLLPALGHAESAADRFAKVKVTSQHVAGKVHMLKGAGGNIAVSVGEDGTLIVDDQYAPLAERIQGAINKLGGERPKYVLNTHYHGDHTGGNAAFGTAATIIAHDNVRIRLLGESGLASVALPVVTFDEQISVHFNGEAIELTHLPTGHTDGDMIVWFRDSNVVHMGDLLFNGSFPYVDVDSGGSVSGVVDNLKRVIAMLPADVKVIPGHGALGGLGLIRTAHRLISESSVLIMREIEAGASDARIIAELDKAYPEAGKGFISAERWLSIVRSSGPGG